jgi:hypothetical protein
MLARTKTDFKPKFPNSVRELGQRIAARTVCQLA